MTKTDISGAPMAGRQHGPRSRAAALLAAIAGGLTLLIRLALHGRSFDLFGDEIIYTDLGRSVVNGGFPRFGGEPFFLHGPGFFYLEGGWEWLAGNQHSLMGWIYEMRTLNALLAAATAGALVLLAVRAGSLWAGAAAGLLFALDPFCIRQNDRVMLETSMMLWVVLGYLVFTSLIERPPWRRSWPRAVGAGLLFGCAVLTKDEAAILIVLPLLAATGFGWGPRRALTLLTVGTTVAVYAAYVALVAIGGQFGDLLAAKEVGIRRMLGMVQLTGFHSAGVGSVQGRLIAEAAYFAATYVVLALAVPALLMLLRRGGQLPRMLGLIYCAAGVALGYAVVLGTLEEQELYLLIVPSILIIPVAATLLVPARPTRGRRSVRTGRDAVSAVVSVLALALVMNLYVCVQWLLQPDDGWAQLIGYMAAHVPASANITDAAIGPNGDISQFALAGEYDVGLWITPTARSQEDVHYVLIPWAEIDDGYSYLTPSQTRHLVSSGRVVFSFRGRTNGDLVLYRIPLPKGGNS